MTTLAAHGISLQLPPTWEGSVTVAQPLDVDAVVSRRLATGRPPALRPTAHVANFALPGDRGDFGSGAVDQMTADHTFIALLEYGAVEAGSALFARRGIPRQLDPAAFDAKALQRTLPGQCGYQVFATEAARAFCLYVVLGRAVDRRPLVTAASSVLESLEVAER